MMDQTIVNFGENNHILGILSHPENSTNKNNDLPALILLNAGIIYRIGPNRIYVKMAKEFAKNGFTTLRFDYSGLGDSVIYQDEEAFDSYQINECIDAMDFLEKETGTSKFILIGICSGGDVGFNTAIKDNRVAGIILINGQLHEMEILRLLSPIIDKNINIRYYKKNLFNYKRWLKLISGKSFALKNIKYILSDRSHKKSGKNEIPISQNFSTDNWEHLINRNIEIFLIYSQGSIGYDIFNLTLAKYMKKYIEMKKVDFKLIKDTDHVFTPQWSQDYLAATVVKWMKKKFLQTSAAHQF